MKKVTYLLGVIGILLITVGFIGEGIGNQIFQSKEFAYDSYDSSSYKDMMQEGYSNRGMMRGFFGNSSASTSSKNGEKLDLGVLEENVERYIARYDEVLTISDVFIYDDSDYYFSIIEEETGKGALELLVNPYTGNVYPEYGPNMMWNLKYGVHYQGGYGMMSGGMMGGYYGNNASYEDNDFIKSNEIALEEAYTIGNEYVVSKLSSAARLSESVHEFYGYYTFHIEEEDTPMGMLSVNSFTGAVWYHDWHGALLDVIEGHSEKDIH